MAQLFGEDQGRYLIACSFDAAEALCINAGQAGVPIATLGRFGGDSIGFGASSAPLADISSLYHTSFETKLFG